MKLDRALQREVLEALKETYPSDMAQADWHRLTAKYGEDHFRANCLYLDAHGLVSWHLMSGGVSLYITYRGLDFLEDDGGLSAILGVVTIKLHDDTIKQLIEAKILASDLPPQEKKRWTDQLRSLPAETTKHLVLKLVDKSLESGPGALAAIGSLLGIAS
ncbi:hypothetical protein LMG26858_02316 [Achromobacter anxifer]|uniref:Uncharacterized protein n=1 Tax=Achromobacter anxifer TaxID=1287737 RepID=A0A6S7CUG2_9BURK|nr:hypothetical protein [Achromobacter anxifer]CAB3862926.1 hypothetical protein LMG26858_02316 [Achromobacter anxifer]